MSDSNLNVGIDSKEAVTGANTAVRSINDISTAANNLQSKLQSMEASMGKLGATSGLSQAKRAMNELNGSSHDLHKLLVSIEDRFVRIGVTAIAMWAVTKAFEAMTIPLKKSVEYLALIETATLGIASSLLVVGQYQDTVTGKVIKGQQALTFARKESKGIIDQLRVANMDTIATLDELIVAYQTALPVAMARGFDKKQVMDFTLAMVQAAGAIGLPFNQMSEEIRSLLTEGAINPRNSRIATVMGLRNEDLAEYKGNAQGLFDFLMKKLEGFTIAGIESQKTLKGIWSNLTDVMKQLGGNAFEGVFSGLKTQLKGLLDSIVTFDSVARTATWTQKWVDGAKSVNAAVTETFNTLVSSSKFLIEHAGFIWGIVKAYAAYQVSQLAVTLTNKIVVASEMQSLQAIIAKQNALIIYGASTAQSITAEQAKVIVTAEGIAADLEAAAAIKAKNIATVQNSAANVFSSESEVIRVNIVNMLLQATVRATEAEYRQAQALWASSRVIVERNAQDVASMQIALEKQVVVAALVKNELQYATAIANTTRMEMDANAVKQMTVGLEVYQIEQTVILQTARQRAALEQLVSQKAITESKMNDAQLEVLRFQGRQGEEAKLTAWRDEELYQRKMLESQTVQQIVLEENLANAKMRAGTRLGLDDKRALNNALLVEAAQLQKTYNAQLANTTGLENKLAVAESERIAAQAALTNSQNILNLSTAERAALAEAMNVAERKVEQVNIELAASNTAVTASQNALLQAKIKQIMIDPELTAAVVRYNSQLTVQQGLIAGTTAAMLGSVQTDFAKLVQQDLLTGSTLAATAVQEAHSAALIINTELTAANTFVMKVWTATTNLASKAMLLLGGEIGVIIIAMASLYWAVDKLLNKERERQTFLAEISNQGGTAKYISELKALQKEIDDLKLSDASPAVKKAMQEEIFLKKQISDKKELVRLETELGKMSWVSKNMTVAPGVTAEQQRNAQIRTLRDSIAAAPALEREKAALTAIRDLEKERVQHKTDLKAPSADKNGISDYNSAVDMYNKLLDEWEMKATKAGKVEDELASKLAVVDVAMKQDIANLREKAKLVGMNTVALERYITQQGKTVKDSISAEDSIKAQKTISDATAKVAKDAYKAELDEEKSLLKLNLDDNLISQQEYHEGMLANISKTTSARIADLEASVSEKEKALYSDASTSGSNQQAKLIADVIKAEGELATFRLLASKEYNKEMNDNVKAIERQRKALVELQNSAKDAQLEVAASKASRIGTSSATGAITNPVANATAVAQSEYDKTIELIKREQDAINEKILTQKLGDEELIALQQRRWAITQQMGEAEITLNQKIASSKSSESQKAYESLASIASKTFPKIQGFEKLAAIASRKYDEEMIKSGEGKDKKLVSSGKLSATGQKQLIGDVAGFGATMFQGLADSQDQSSRKGFEAAKAYSIAAAVMSTAAAVMNAFATMPWPAAPIAAALAAAMGVIQIAKIASTSFGGGGSVNASVPTGSFAAGGASGTGSTTGLGSSVGSSVVSIQEQQTGKQLDLIAERIGNAALAMGKSANALFDIAGYMKNSMSGNIAAGAPGTLGVNEQSISGNHNTAVNVSAMAIGAAAGAKAGTVIGTMILPGVGTIVGAAIGVVVGTLVGWATSLFGSGPWKQEGSGFTLGLNSGDVATQGYVNMRSEGGLFHSDRTRTDYFEADSLFTQGMQNFLDKMTSSIKVGAVALGQSGEAWEKAMETVTVAPITIATAGRNAEDIQKDTIAAFTKIQNTIIETTIPNIMNYALSAGETATDVYTRLASAIMDVVPQLELVGSAIKYAGMSGAQAAYLMQDAFGGADKMATAMDDYFTSMYTDAEQASMKAQMDKTAIESVFLAMHLAVPTTVAEFNALRSSITDPALFVALTQIGPTFAEMTKQATEAKAALSAFSSDLISRGLKLDGQNSLADLYDLKVIQENEMIDATKNGMDTQWLAIVQQKEWANAIKTASETVDAATQKIIDSAKKALTDSISTAQSILNTLHGILTGPSAMLSPEAAYTQAKATFASADSSNISAAATALLEASKNYNASGEAYQADYQMVIAKLGVMAETTPTVSYVDQQIALLTSIQKAITDGDLAMMKALDITYNAAQIDMGNAKNSLSLALTGIQDALNTTITAGTATDDMKTQISALQNVLDTTVVDGTAKTAIENSITAIQLALNGTISSTDAELAVKAAYDTVNAALNKTIDGTTAAGLIALQGDIAQVALKKAIDGDTASAAIKLESDIAQLAISGALDGTQAKQAIDVERNIIQGVLDGSISGADARTKLLAEKKIIQDVLDGSIDGTTVANQLSSQFTTISDSLTTGLSGFIAKLETLTKAMTDASSGNSVEALSAKLAAIDAFAKAQSLYQTTSSGLLGQYKSNALSAEDFASQNAAAFAPYNAAYITATNLGTTQISATQVSITALDTVARLLDTYLKDKTILDDYIARGVQAVKSNPGGVAPYIMLNQQGVVADDLETYRAASIAAGVTPSYAVGTPSVPYDMTANIHQGEIIMDRASSDVLRKYGIPSQQADNSNIIVLTDEMRAMRAELKALRQQQAREAEQANEVRRDTSGKVVNAVGGNSAARIRY